MGDIEDKYRICAENTPTFGKNVLNENTNNLKAKG